MKRTHFIILLSVLPALTACNKDGTIQGEFYGNHPITENSSRFGHKVFEYRPAPGQFINSTDAGFSEIRSAEDASTYATKRLNDFNSNVYVSLGGFGGYIVVGFDHSVQSRGNYGGYDFSVTGNQFPGSSEPGIVWVMQDDNGNGRPDGIWYELKGSEYGNPETVRDYEVTYYRPSEPSTEVRWADNKGNEGVIERTPEHPQEYYYPMWIEGGSYTLSGVCLPRRDKILDNGDYHTGNYDWGYADNYGSDRQGQHKTLFKISNAVDKNGNPAELKYIDFVKIQTGVNIQGKGGTGELSTEVCLIEDENMNKK